MAQAPVQKPVATAQKGQPLQTAAQRNSLAGPSHKDGAHVPRCPSGTSFVSITLLVKGRDASYRPQICARCSRPDFTPAQVRALGLGSGYSLLRGNGDDLPALLRLLIPQLQAIPSCGRRLTGAAAVDGP